MNTWLTKASSIIQSGGVVALAYESLFGLAADAMNEGAVMRSAQIKERAPDKPISVIVPNMDAVFRVASSFPAEARALAAAHWPGPLTLLLPARDDIPAQLIGPGNLVGLRIPGSSPALELARTTGCILTATSANRTGGPDAIHSDELRTLEGVDLIVPGTVAGPPGSTIVNASGKTPVILRQGRIEIG